MSDKHSRSALISMYQNRAAYYAKYAALWRDKYLLGRWRWIWGKRRISEDIQRFQTLAEIYALTAQMLAGTEDSAADIILDPKYDNVVD